MEAVSRLKTAYSMAETPYQLYINRRSISRIQKYFQNYILTSNQINRLINGAAVTKRRNANFQHPKLLGKQQLKLYRDSISPYAEWLSSRKQDKLACIWLKNNPHTPQVEKQIVQALWKSGLRYPKLNKATIWVRYITPEDMSRFYIRTREKRVCLSLLFHQLQSRVIKPAQKSNNK